MQLVALHLKLNMDKIEKENCFNENTLLLNTTDDTDVIENSILKYECDEDFIKRGNIHSCKSKYSSNHVKTKLSHVRHFKNNHHPMDVNNALRFSLSKVYNLVDNADKVEEFEPLETPNFRKNSKDTNFIMKKLISTLKKTPERPYLSKSKLRNIQQWLADNDTETVMTPPFANLSVTPRNTSHISHRGKSLSSRSKENKSYEESSIDSEVEGVLKAVYGDNWKLENVKSRPKTEPQKGSKKTFLAETETNKRKTNSIRCVRRNILSAKKLNLSDSSEEKNELDNSVLSGVRMMPGMDGSCSSDEEIRVETQNSNCIWKERKEEAVTDRKNLKSKTTPRNLCNKKLPSRTPLSTPKKTFLASLSVSTPTSRCHPDAQQYKVNFKSKKDELIIKLYKLYNSEVFDGKLPEEMNFGWNVKLRGTAGYCYNKRITKSTGEVIRMSRIEFSTKIVDRADRLRDTMIHELCHAASWVVDGVLDGHGAVWTEWASRAMSRFPELPTIKRCHNYDIVSKYVYKCTSCGYAIKRHSKSINTGKKRCGHCYGVLELLINRKKRGKGEVPEFDTTRTLPTPNKFALFVKENYHSVKSSKGNAKHSEVMKTLSQQYALIKNGPTSAKKLLQE